MSDQEQPSPVDTVVQGNLVSANGSIDRELQSLLSLMDDPDARTWEAVEMRLRSRGAKVIDALAEFAENTGSELARERAQGIVFEHTRAELRQEFMRLRDRLDIEDPTAFEDGIFLIARYGNPQLKLSDYRAELDDFAALLKEDLNGLSSALEILDAVNHFFFDELRFRGNQAKFMEPENSYIDCVMDRRMGIPISLAVVFLLVTQHRLKLPFSGASAPGHFLIRYDGLHSEALFIDAFNGGVVLRERDIKRYLDTSGLPFNKSFLAPASPRSVLLRMIRNLIIVFNEIGNREGRTAFEEYMRILAPDTAEGQAFLRGLES